MIIDQYNRNHDYLRISLTDKCNLRCEYCTAEYLPIGKSTNSKYMSAAEIDSIAAVFIKNGVNKIRLTGGEPLVRKDAKEIIEKLSKYPIKLTITTNGVFVNDFIETFKNAAINSVNVSLDTLVKEQYLSITKRDEFDKVMQNIDMLLANNFHVKINVVAIKNFNHHEILNFIEWTKEKPLHIRFIEFMPFSGNEWSKEKVFTHEQILEVISSKHNFMKLINEKNDTAKKYFIPNYKGTFAVISTMSEPFCSGCNRMRLTAEGKMYNCLFGKQETDILGAFRAGNDIEPLIYQSVKSKKEMLGGNNENINWGKENTETREISMIGLGG
jgi:cyclic pyranopterin phosphate synthase